MNLSSQDATVVFWHLVRTGSMKAVENSGNSELFLIQSPTHTYHSSTRWQRTVTRLAPLSVQVKSVKSQSPSIVTRSSSA